MSDETELKAEVNKLKDDMRMILSKVSDAEIQLLDYRKCTEKLEEKIENQELKIKQLEDSLGQKVIESGMKDEIKKPQAEKIERLRINERIYEWPYLGWTREEDDDDDCQSISTSMQVQANYNRKIYENNDCN
ncbi:Oidioi.mRNA.OKI2018_I69.chr1.g310.t1.cds [Oikopleura dioica]|uniref:Oidioi.mRNA.OKI2018_I69.chr1.g310.t1.cds n=1 Tax=Oikopleura dioica TaxID=34765 RepID=A0ABN7SN59_OIKDI|nr:Oidioi.mRNA.OKI2018_I69.chr1.g310.t1.cds [Oikopleura dioica]